MEVLEPERLSHAAQESIPQNRDRLYLSPTSTWEAMILARKGKIQLDPTRAGRGRRAPALRPPRDPALTRDRAPSEALDGFDSRDPADRFLVATALEHDFTLVTADERMRAYEPLNDALVATASSARARSPRAG